MINFTANWCDSYVEFIGEIDERGFIGRAQIGHGLATAAIGHVIGVPVFLEPAVDDVPGTLADTGDTFDWDKKGPLEFLEQLREATLHQDIPTCVVSGVHAGWVQEHHLPDLIALLDSKEPCASVRTAFSSFVDFDHAAQGRLNATERPVSPVRKQR